MEGGNLKDRWSMLKCSSGAQDKTIINQIMLRYRPIAPKPVNNTNGLDSSLLKSTANNNILVSKKKNKRKYVRVRKNNNNNNNNNKRKSKRNIQQQKVSLSSSSTSPDQEDKGKQIEDIDRFDNKNITLQLLPEGGDDPLKDRLWCNNNENIDQEKDVQLELNLSDQMKTARNMTTVLYKKVVVESLVTVECVTDSCMDGLILGCTDMERVNKLEADKRPGFISDDSNSVRWVNGAYKKMVMMESQKEDEDDRTGMEIIVWLVAKEKLSPYVYCSAFTCWVRLQYCNTFEKVKFSNCSSQMVPCDVWRMDCGGFAWRLDIEAALSLGRRFSN